MAYQLTERAQNFAAKVEVEPNIALCIDGIDECFGSAILEVTARFGENDIYFGQSGLKFGGLTRVKNSDSLISLSGTSDTITQQLEPDKGAASSTQTVRVKLIDEANKITKLVSPGFVVDDVLFRRAKLYLGLKGTSFPDDYLQLFDGIIQQISTQAGAVELTIAHPEDFKRSEVFFKSETDLIADLNFLSKQIQDLFFAQRGDVTGTVDVQYIAAPFTGDTATVNVSGNLIIVSIDPAATTAKTIKKFVENHPDANQLVTVRVRGNANAIQTVIPITSLVVSDEVLVDSIEGFLLPSLPLFRTFVKINEEIIEYTGIDTVNKKFTGCTRAVLATFGAIHEEGDTVESFYVLGDNTVANSNAIDLALKVMLSGGPEYYAESVPADTFVDLGVPPIVANGILFRGVDIKEKYGVTVGDYVTITGDPNPANNVSDAEIVEISDPGFGSLVIIAGPPLVISLGSPAVAKFKSRFNVLPDGLQMFPSQVDIDEFIKTRERYFSSMPAYEFFLKDTEKAKELINEQMFLPAALYSIPRKGRVSVGFTAPPLFDEFTQTLDADAVKKPSSLKIDRTVNRNFYNSIVYRFNEDSIEDKFLSGRVVLSTDSTSRIKSPNRPFTITSRGLRPSNETFQLVARNALRFLSRYEFAAEYLDVEVPFKNGWGVEVGDAAIFGDEKLKVADTSRGDRNFQPRIYEVMNKTFNWKQGRIQLTLLDANFAQGVRYAVWSPSSKVSTGSTTTKIVIENSFGTLPPKREKTKWNFYIGKKVLVRSPDWATQYETTLQGFDPADDFKMVVNPALPSAPSAGFVVTLLNYENIPLSQNVLKEIHPFWTPTLEVVSGASNTSFDVSPTDFAKLFVGSPIRVHAEDYSIDSGVKPVRVSELIAPGTVICDDLGFTPAAGQKVNFVGFEIDEGRAYAWL